MKNFFAKTKTHPHTHWWLFKRIMQMLVGVMMATAIQAQMPAPNGTASISGAVNGSSCTQRLVGRVTFAYCGNANDPASWTLDDIQYEGPAIQLVTVPSSTYNGVAQMANDRYTIVKNPSTVLGPGGASMQNVGDNDGMLLVRRNADDAIRYKIEGLNKHSGATSGLVNYFVRIRMYQVGNGTLYGDAGNNNNQVKLGKKDYTDLGWGSDWIFDARMQCTGSTSATTNWSGKGQEGAGGYLKNYGNYVIYEGTFRMYHDNNSRTDEDGFSIRIRSFTNNNSVIGIESIEVYGCMPGESAGTGMPGTLENLCPPPCDATTPVIDQALPCRGDLSARIMSDPTNAFWQVIDDGIDETYPATSPFLREDTSIGGTGTTYYLRSKGMHNGSPCWSGAASVTVVNNLKGTPTCTPSPAVTGDYKGGYVKTSPEQWTAVASNAATGIAFTSGCGGADEHMAQRIVLSNNDAFSAWQSGNSCANRGINLDIDTKAERAFNRIALQTNNNTDYAGTAFGLTLYGSNDGITYTEIPATLTRAGSDENRRNELNFSAVEYRYIRIYNQGQSNSGGGGHWAIREMFLHYTPDLGTCGQVGGACPSLCDTPTADAGSGTTIKIGQTYQLGAASLDPNTSGAWSIVDGPVGTAGSFSNAALPSAIFTPGEEGTYTLRWTVTNTKAGCSSFTADDDVEIIVNPECDDVETVLTVSAASTTICTGTGTNIVLEDSEVGVIYALFAGASKVGGNQTGDGGNLTFSTGSLAAQTTFVIRTAAENTDFCPNITIGNSVTVNVSSASVGGTATETEATILAGNSTTINLADNTGTIQWQTSEDGNTNWGNVANGIGATTASYTTATTLVAGTYYFRALVTNSPCSSAISNTVTITVKDPSEIPDPDDAVCQTATTVYMLFNNFSGRYIYENASNIITLSNAQYVTLRPADGETANWGYIAGSRLDAYPTAVANPEYYWVLQETPPLTPLINSNKAQTGVNAFGTWRNLSSSRYLTLDIVTASNTEGRRVISTTTSDGARSQWKFNDANAAGEGGTYFVNNHTSEWNPNYAAAEESCTNGTGHSEATRTMRAGGNWNGNDRGTKGWFIHSAPNPYDLSVLSVSTSTSLVEIKNPSNNTFVASAVIKNAGTVNITKTIKVKFAFNGQFYYTTIASLNAGAETTVTATITPLFLTNGTPVIVTVNSNNNIPFESNCANNITSSDNVKVVDEILFKYYKHEGDEWSGSVDGIVWDEDVATPPSGIDVEEIYINDEFMFPAGVYTTKLLELGTKAQVNIAGAATLIADSLVLTSTDTYSAQVQSFSASHLTARVVALKKYFQRTKWYQFTVPFPVEKIYDTQGNELTIYNDYFVRTYNSVQRALGIYDAADTPNWGEYMQAPDPDAGSGNILAANKGYLFGHANMRLEDETIVFVSPPDANAANICVAGTKNLPIQEYPSESELHEGWNFLGNPYTTAYHMNRLDGFTVYAYDKNLVKYETIPDDPEDMRALCILEPYRAFFIQTKNNGLLQFNDLSAIAFKSAPTASLYDEIKLTLSNSAYADWFSVRLHEKATAGFDMNIDGLKLLENGCTVQQLYSRQSNVNYAINALPREIEKSIIVPLSYRIPKAGDYTLSYVPTDKSKNVIGLLLRDLTLKTEVDLLNSPDYPLATTSNGANSDTRFELEIVLRADDGGLPTEIPYANLDGKIFATVSNSYVSLRGLDALSAVSVFGVTGGKIADFENVDNGQPLFIGATGVYLLKVSNAAQSATIKVILK